MQRQRLLSDRQHFQREQMKLLELRSPTTLTPQTPLPLTPSARHFVVPTTKLAPPPATNDAAKDTTASEEGGAKDNHTTSGDIGQDIVTIADNSVQGSSTEVKEDVTADVSDVLTAAESGGGAEILPPVKDDTAVAEDLFPIDFPNSDHQSPVIEDHMISEGNETAIQQSMEFEGSNELSTDIVGSHDPTEFDGFDNMGQFDQSDDLPETNQSNQLPQQPVPLDINRQSDIGVQQLEEVSTDAS